jgi:hypothetical protein
VRLHVLTPNTAAELRRSIRAERERIREHRAFYAAGWVIIAIGFALVALFKLERSVFDLPLLLLAGAVHAMQYVGLYLFVWVIVITKLVYESTMDRLQDAWARKESQRKPGRSFPVAYWRFLFVAGPAAGATFFLLAAGVVVVFFMLPMRINAIPEVLQAVYSAVG